MRWGALARLPRGNQLPAAEVVMHRGLTVRQTELLVTRLVECEDDAGRAAVTARWLAGEVGSRGRAPTRAASSEADWLATDLNTLLRIAARVQARLLATPLLGFGSTAAELLGRRSRESRPCAHRPMSASRLITGSAPRKPIA